MDNTLVRNGSETGSYLMLIKSCITQLKVQGPSRTCNESKEEEEEGFTQVWELGRARFVVALVPDESREGVCLLPGSIPHDEVALFGG